MFHHFSSFILKGLMFACSVCLVLLSLWCLVHLCQLCFPHYPSVSLCSVLGRLFVSCHWNLRIVFMVLFRLMFMFHVIVFMISFSLPQFRFYFRFSQLALAGFLFVIPATINGLLSIILCFLSRVSFWVHTSNIALLDNGKIFYFLFPS